MQIKYIFTFTKLLQAPNFSKLMSTSRLTVIQNLYPLLQPCLRTLYAVDPSALTYNLVPIRSDQFISQRTG